MLFESCMALKCCYLIMHITKMLLLMTKYYVPEMLLFLICHSNTAIIIMCVTEMLLLHSHMSLNVAISITQATLKMLLL